MPTSLTLAALTTRVRALTNINSAARLSDDEIVQALVEANSEIGDAKPWPHLRRVDDAIPVAADGLLSLPANVRAVAAVRNAAGSPYAFELVNGVWWAAPAPGAAGTVTVEYFVETPDLSTSVGPFADAVFHPLWAYLAAYRILEQKGADPRKVETLMGQASDLAERMRKRYLLSASTEVFSFRGAK